ncbi:MAG TPA: hypothetical protein VIH15_12925, partial [Casimicrobiaceae bacterium]
MASRSGARQVAMIEARMSFGEQACSCQRESDGVGHDERRTLLVAHLLRERRQIKWVMQHKRTAAQQPGHQRKAHAGKGGRSQRRLDDSILRDAAFQQNCKPARQQFGMTARDRHDAAFAGIEGDRRDMGCGIAPGVVGLDRCRI